MTVPTKAHDAGSVLESVLMKGDLSKLTPEERVRYYRATCESMGLNPLTKPFEYITLNGKLQLYALRACADQLRKVNGVSLEIVSREVSDGILTVHVRARLPDGRCDEELGSVAFPDQLKGEARANAELKAVTKAKRRATLSICGLGWLDETEIGDIPGARRAPPPPAPNVLLPKTGGQWSDDPPHNPQTGEITDSPATTSPPDSAPPLSVAEAPTEPAAANPQTTPPTGGGLSSPEMPTIALEGFEVAKRGMAQLERWWATLLRSQQKQLIPYKDELKAAAEDADARAD